MTSPPRPNQPNGDRRSTLVEGCRVDDYELIRIVGEGSFAVVWEARHCRLGRVAAVKIPHGSRRNERDAGRFLHEAKIGARLCHPFIVQVYDCGYCPDTDLQYMATELIEGVAMSDWARYTALDHRLLVQLLQKVARALHYAHQQGVIHRDLKPDNVIVDLVGEPHITDFGLARDLHQRMTETNIALGTVAYMSPEQARGDSGSADGRADIYAVGVMLFELLTGTLPFDAASLPRYLSLLATSEAPDPHRIRPGIPRDLSLICAKCLRTIASDRYDSAAELADDLERWLDRKPVRARPLNPGLRLARWSMANRWATCALILLGSIAIAAPLVGFRFRQQHLQLISQSRKDQLARYFYDMRRGLQEADRGDLREVSNLLSRHQPADGATDNRDFAWYWLDLWMKHRHRKIAQAGEALYAVVALESRGEIAAAADSGRIMIWDSATGALKRVLKHHSEPLYALEKSHDERLLFAARIENGAQTVAVYDVASGQIVDRIDLPFQKTIESIEMSPDGTVLAIGERHSQVVFVAWPSKQVMHACPSKGRQESLQFSPDGSKIAIVGRKEVQIRNVRSGELLWEGATPTKPLAAVWTTDGRELLVARQSANGLTRIRPEKGQENLAVPVKTAEIHYLSMSVEGTHVWTGGVDGSVYRIPISPESLPVPSRLDLGADHLTFSGHIGRVYDLCVRSNGECLTVGADGAVLGSRAAASNASRAWRLPSVAERMAFLKGTKQLVCGSEDGAIYLDGRQQGPKDVWIQSLFAQKANDIVMGLHDGRLRIWSSNGESETVAQIEHAQNGITALHYCEQEGQWLLGTGTAIYTWSTGQGEPSRRLGTTSPTHAFAHWQGGGLVFAGGRYEDVIVLDHTSLALRARLENKSGCSSMVLNEARGVLITGHWDSTIRVWDLNSLQSKCVLSGHKSAVRSIALHPSGNVLASAGYDGTVRLWRLDLEEEYGIIARGQQRASSVRFSDDGRALAGSCVGSDGQSTEVQVWDVGTP